MDFEPIVLNEAGDTLVSGRDVLSEATPLFYRTGFRFAKIGEHGLRRHDIILLELSGCNVIICQEAVLRVEIPKSVDTYGKLRQWCKARIQRQELQLAVEEAMVNQFPDQPHKEAVAAILSLLSWRV